MDTSLILISEQITFIVSVMIPLLDNINAYLHHTKQINTLIDPLPYNGIFMGELVETVTHLTIKLIRAKFDAGLVIKLCELVALPLPLTHIEAYNFLHFECQKLFELQRNEMVK